MKVPQDLTLLIMWSSSSKTSSASSGRQLLLVDRILEETGDVYHFLGSKLMQLLAPSSLFFCTILTSATWTDWSKYMAYLQTIFGVGVVAICQRLIISRKFSSFAFVKHRSRIRSCNWQVLTLPFGWLLPTWTMHLYYGSVILSGLLLATDIWFFWVQTHFSMDFG